MNIFFRSEDHCDYFFFFEIQDSPRIVLPENIFLCNFLTLVQSSLDQIRPVVILAAAQALTAINLSECSSFHFKCVENNFIFLNYSIRNSLTKSLQDDFQLKSFEEIQSFLTRNFQK